MSCMYTYHMQYWCQGKATCLLDVNISAYLKSLNFFEKALQLHACSPAVFWRVVSAFVASVPGFRCAAMSGPRRSFR